MKRSPESKGAPPRELTVNLAGLSAEQLAEISPLIGGSDREVTAGMPEDLLAARTVIVPWGDGRLRELLAEVTAASGYPYGAEQTHIVATTEKWATWLLVVPKVPYDIDDVRDDKGEIDGGLLALMDPSMNTNAVFYEWDDEGAQEIELYHKHAELGHRPWIDMGDYFLAFELSMSL